MNSKEPCCLDYKPNIDKINGFITLASVRSGKDLWDGKTFKYCPYCGKELKLETMEN